MINKSQDEIIKNWPNQWDKPLVSIRCLAYNHEKFIGLALDGFLMQETNFPFEVVVHDDASTDGTANIIREYEKKYPKIIKPIYETENQYSKHDGSLNRIMNRAYRGDYIAYCEGDDFWISSDKLQKQVDILIKDESVSLVHTGFITVDEDGKVLHRPTYEKFQQLSLKDKGLVSLFKTNHILTLSIILRKEVVFSDLFINSPYSYDYAIFFAAAFAGKLRFIPQKMGAYRKNSSGLMQTKASSVNNQLRAIYRYFAFHYMNNKVSVSLFDRFQINFWIMEHFIAQRVYSCLVKMLLKNPLRCFLLPFCFLYYFVYSLKK